MKNKKTFKEAFGTNPWDPWSAKAGLAETTAAQLEKYLLSRGIDPKYVTKDVKIAHSKSNQFKQWAATHKEEVESDDVLNEASTTQLHKYLMSRGINPLYVSKDSKIAHAKSNQFKQWAATQKEEVQNEDHVAIAMGKQLDDEGSMVLNQLDILDSAIAKLRAAVKDPKMQIPAWVQSKITLAADYMDTVGHYMTSKNEDGMNEEVELEEGMENGVYVRRDLQGKPIAPKPTLSVRKYAVKSDGTQGKELKLGTLTPYTDKEKKEREREEIRTGHIPADKYKEHMKKYGHLYKKEETLDEAKALKIKIKDKPPTAAEKLYQKHQAIRKASGLPDPSVYKKKLDDMKKEETELDESVLYDNPKGTLTRVTERRKEMSRSARIIKALYKKKGMKEDTYDWEKDDKSTASYGKQPKFTKSDDKASKVKKESDAAAVLSGGTTMTKQKRDIVELDPKMKMRPNKDAQDADDNNTN